MSHEQNAGQNCNVKTGDQLFEKVEQFIYFETTLTNQNCICEEINSTLKSRNAIYHTVQNLLSSGSVSKNINIKITAYRTIILPVVSYGCETWSLTSREEHRLRVFRMGLSRKIFGP